MVDAVVDAAKARAERRAVRNCIVKIVTSWRRERNGIEWRVESTAPWVFIWGEITSTGVVA